jgi:hypothetical protein
MRQMTAALALAAVVLGLAAPGLAINCDQARKYAATGRSAEDIADTMVADPAEVKKCLAEGGGAPDGISGTTTAPSSGTASGQGGSGSSGSGNSGAGQPGH